MTWNVAGRIGRQPEQAEALLGAGADVIALQEVTIRTAPLWRSSLAGGGFGFVEDALDGLPPRPSKRRLAVLTAARSQLARLEAPVVPWPERVLRCAVDGIEVINVHSPIAPSPELAKIRTHEAVAAHTSLASGSHHVCCVVT